MSLLSDLPDDILNLISIRLNGFDNCSLWMASDSILRQRLVNNVITDFDIKYTIPGRYLWPGNFLKKLQRLSRLSLLVNESLHHIPIQNIELFEIPTLKYLALSVANFQIFELKPKSTGPTTSSDNKYINLNEYYCNLEYFEIMCLSLEHRLFVDFLRVLPQKLQVFIFPQLELDPENPTDDLNSHIAILPRSLTELSGWFGYPFENEPSLDLTQLPPNLTSLTTNVSLDDQTSHVLPNTLKSLEIYDSAVNLDDFSPRLPTGLTHLSLMIHENPSAGQFFLDLQNLESLSIYTEESIKLDDFIMKCPPKLKSFGCNNIELTDVPLTSSIFGNIISLHLNNVAGISGEFISMLPQSLTSLNMFESFPIHEPFAFFSHLPRNLKALTFNFIIFENTSLLPESLTCFNCSAKNSSVVSYFDRLPPKLETLNVKQKIPRSIMESLPDSLIRLQVACDEVVDDEIVQKLPRGLKEFSLNSPDTITDAALADLPPCLTNLILYRNTTITDDGIAFLPRTLTRLNFPENRNLTDKCVKDLPPKLITLHLNQARKITSHSCKDLPKYLQMLDLPSCYYWEPKVLIASKNELPQFIENINLGYEEANKTWKNLRSK